MDNELKHQQPDVTEPSSERKFELEKSYERQKNSSAPYQGIQIRTLGELNWILEQRNWSGKLIGVTNETLRPNLSGIVFKDAILIGVELSEANLHAAKFDQCDLGDARFFGADLSNADLYASWLGNADLRYANLRNAELTNAELSKASLLRANLKDAQLSGAHLNGASLENADLSGADMSGANLNGANMRRALLDATTTLDNPIFNSQTMVLGTRWNGAPLDAVNWVNMPRLGNEPTPEEIAKGNVQERAVAYRNATRAYHGLVVALRDQGLNETASKYRLRELVMERKALWQERNFGGWFLNMLLGAVAGHGEKPGRAFAAYLGIVTFFAALFGSVTTFLPKTGTPPLQWYEAIVLSLSSFHGRGFFTNTISLGDPLAIIGALEAVMGLFIELIFIATFSRRFLGD